MRLRFGMAVLAIAAAPLSFAAAAADDSGLSSRELAPATTLRPGTVFRDCADCPEMVAIPPGTFAMGSPPAEHGRFDAEGPLHRVAVRAFALGRYDVTVEQFTAFVRDSRYLPGTCDWPPGSISTWRSEGFAPTDPAVCVSWRDAQAYVAWLNGKVGAGASAAVRGGGPYRLPSEAEWEYAARAGSKTARWWGETIGTGNANCNGCGSRWDNVQLSPVGSFAANPFGLYDMLGDVWQWTADCWNESYVGAPADGSAWTGGDCTKRVRRGGSWSNLPEFVRSAARAGENAQDRSYDYASYTGFRVAKTLP